MPNKPTTLREEFNEWIQERTKESEDGAQLETPSNSEIADWWLEKFSSHNTELLEICCDDCKQKIHEKR